MELIVSIVVIAVAVSGVLLAVQFTTRYSANPMIRQQAVAIADAYMEEILLQHYTEPEEGVNESGQDESESRSTYDDVYDYNNTINEQDPTDQTGNPMPGLENYEVTVVVDNSSTFGPGGGLDQAANVTVTVTHESADVEFTLNAFKTKY